MNKCKGCGAPANALHRVNCPMAYDTPEPKEQWMKDCEPGSDNPFADILSTLQRIEAKLDRINTPAIDSGKEYLTVAEAADIFNLSKASLYRLKQLHCRRGRSVRFRRSDLALHLRASRAAA